MKGRLLILITMLAAFALFSFTAAGLAQKPKESTIQGVVTPVDWDDEDNVTRVAILVETEVDGDDDEATYVTDEYLVENDAKGRELFAHLDKNVQVVGVVTEDEDGNKFIKVSSFKVLDKE